LLPVFEELRGERVLLRPYRLDDASAAQAAIAESREHIRRFEDFADDFQTVEEMADRIVLHRARWLLRDDFSMGIWLAQTERYLGGIGLHPISEGGWAVSAFALGYWVRVTEQGHGYVAEAVRLITTCAFDSLGARRVEIRCNARNVRSANVARRCGFELEGHLRSVACAPDGTVADELVFARIAPPPDRQSRRRRGSAGDALRRRVDGPQQQRHVERLVEDWHAQAMEHVGHRQRGQLLGKCRHQDVSVPSRQDRIGVHCLEHANAP
jgi:RimJ/RimL family protein N-acetyltransferase